MTTALRIASAALGLALAAPALGQSAAEGDRVPPQGGRPAQGAPSVSLDRLLRLPDSLDVSVERRGGSTRGEWRSRFEAARAAIENERAALALAQAELDEVASTSAWQVGPPIPGSNANPDQTPLDFRLRQEIRRHRDEIERLERQLRALEVEANLAEVPADWRY